MASSDGVTALRIRTDERTFKSLADQILHLTPTTDNQRIQRAALINSARSFINSQLASGDTSYRSLESYMTPKERGRQCCSMDITRIKSWLQHNLDVFEKKSKGQVSY